MLDPVHVLTHEFPPFRGGIGVYVEETARALSGLGLPVTVWAPDYGQAATDAFPFQVKRIPMRGKQDWLCRIQLGKAIRKAFPGGRIPGTVILAEPGPIRLWLYERFFRLPTAGRLVVVLHGSEIRTLCRPAHRRMLFRRLLDRADCLGVVSDEVGRLLRAEFSGLEGRLVRVSGAVRSAWCDLPVPVRSETGAPTEILQVGRLHPRKGQHVLIEAVARLPEDIRRQIQVRLIGPVGKRPYFQGLQAQLRKVSLPVALEGPLSEEELRLAYERARILVMPSQPFGNSIEGLGLTLLEAAQFGCAVIGTGIGGIPEAMREGETGLLVPPEDPAALASAIENLVRDRARAEAMGRAGAAFVRQRFSWSSNAARLAGMEEPGDSPSK